jgi:aspartate kinase
MIVMKFGGTSVQDAAAIEQVTEIVRSKLDRRPVVVVSAMAKATDALLKIARLAGARRFEQAAAVIEELRARHLTTAAALLEGQVEELDRVERTLQAYFEELSELSRSIATLGELTPRSQDAITSFGERLSSLIVAAAFRARGIDAELVDSRKFLITDSNFNSAAPDQTSTDRMAVEILMPLVDSGRVPVAQGFIGSNPDGITTTIGRGGGDYSAAIFGAALRAEAIEIWTDVDGLMTADPRIVPDAKRIRVVSFSEAAELSYFGARVLHPSTVLPAVRQSIPVHIYNTRNPSSEGTLIVAEPRRTPSAIKSIAFKRGITIVNVASTRMIMAHGFLRTIFEVFDRHQTSIDVVTTAEASVSMTLDSTERLDLIRHDLGNSGEVRVEPGKAIVCVVGDNLKFTPGVAARLFRALGNINVNMVSQGASEINLTFVIDEAEIEHAVQLLHHEFFKEVDQAVFA